MHCEECKKKISDQAMELKNGVFVCDPCFKKLKTCTHPRLKTYRDPSDGELTMVCRECGDRPSFI